MLGAVLLLAPGVSARADQPASGQVSSTTSPAGPTTTTRAPRDLPRTVLELEERDDGDESPGPWLIGSGIAAVAVIGIGGTILKRRSG